MVGWSHHRTPIEIREKLAFTQEQVAATLQQFGSQFPNTESVLVSTCNRTELYCTSPNLEELPPADELALFLTDHRGLSFDVIRSCMEESTGEAVIKHLFSVASSLESMVLGEAQILSQVKMAYEQACQTGNASTGMHRAFQRATVVARRIANETAIHKRRTSVPSVAVSEIATDFFERFDDKRILLIGAGDMGMETMQYLIDAGAKRIRIVNRSQDRAQELAQRFSAQAEDWSNLTKCISESDLIVSTTSATEPIITAEQFRSLRSRRSHAVLILDLAVPRDFDPAIANLADVYLFTVDDLQQVCQRNLQARAAELPKAYAIVEEETQRFLSESIHQGSGPTIKRLREQAQQIKDEELNRLMTKLQTRGVDEQTQKELAISFDRLVNKLLHAPLQSLREHADTSHHETLLDSLRRLFHLND